MSCTIPPAFGPSAPTLAQLRGHRFIDGEGGANPQTAASGGENPAPGSEPSTGTNGAQPPADGGAGGESVDSLPAWAQRIIRDTRKEAGDYRAAKNTTEQQLSALKDAAAVALGLKQADAADPAALTAQLQAAQGAAKQNAIQLAAYRAAAQHGANPDALLDSASFLATAQQLDHTAADFGAQLSNAVKAAVDGNPILRGTTRAVGASGPSDAGGTGENGLITEAQLAAAAKDNPEQVATWLSEGKLTHLL